MHRMLERSGETSPNRLTGHPRTARAGVRPITRARTDVAYVVPGEHGSSAPGERLVNWAAYILLAEEHLE